MTDAPIFIAGHSLGGADAYEYAFSRVQRGLRVDGVYAFEPPNPGDHVIGNVLRASVPILVGTKNHRDLVTDVPPDIVAANEEYVQPTMAFTELNNPGTGIDFLFRDHHIDLIVAGVHAHVAAIGGAVGINEAVDQVARLYDSTAEWDWLNQTDGLYWGMKIMPSGAKLMIRRGSKTGRDWLTEDFDFVQINIMGARMSRGFAAGWMPIQDQLDAQLT